MFPESISSNHHQQQKSAPLLNGFVHRSPLATSPHDPHICLGSHCVRSAFGETVQLVADALQTRGALTYQQLVAVIRQETTSRSNNKATTTPTSTTTTMTPPLSCIRASLLVLLQHSICSVDYRRQKGVAYYIYHANQAVYLLRHARFVEWTRKYVDATAACVIETLLLAGRLRTTDVVLQAAAIAPKSDRYTARQAVLEAFYKLVNAGFVHQVPPLKQQQDDDSDEGEFEFEADEPPKKKVKLDRHRHKISVRDDEESSLSAEDPAVLALLSSNANYKSLPVDAVWKTNITMYHEVLRSFILGKLVAERYGHRVQSCGSMVTAALRHRSNLKHCGAGRQRSSDSNAGDDLTFAPQDVIRYLPKPVLQLLEKKAGNNNNNVAAILAKAFSSLSEFDNPPVVRRVGSGDDTHRYEINIPGLAKYLNMRTVHKVIKDRHGESAARIISILDSMGWMESDRLAEHAMVTPKDAREILHRLYRSKYVDLFQASAARVPTPSNTIYMWRADPNRLMKQVTENVALALWNIRLRRQHQVEVYGKDWMDRAEQADEMDENEHEADRVNRQRFANGLDRLDNAVLELDETLMVLRDFAVY